MSNDKPFTFKFGDGPELTADELPTEEQRRMGEAIAETMASFGVEGILFEDPSEEEDS